MTRLLRFSFVDFFLDFDWFDKAREIREENWEKKRIFINSIDWTRTYISDWCCIFLRPRPISISSSSIRFCVHSVSDKSFNLSRSIFDFEFSDFERCLIGRCLQLTLKHIQCTIIRFGFCGRKPKQKTTKYSRLDFVILRQNESRKWNAINDRLTGFKIQRHQQCEQKKEAKRNNNHAKNRQKEKTEEINAADPNQDSNFRLKCLSIAWIDSMQFFFRSFIFCCRSFRIRWSSIILLNEVKADSATSWRWFRIKAETSWNG